MTFPCRGTLCLALTFTLALQQAIIVQTQTEDDPAHLLSIVKGEAATL